MGLEKTKVNKFLGIFMIILVVGFAGIVILQLSSVFIGPSKKSCTKQVCLAKFLEGPPAFNDAALRKFLLENHFARSSDKPNYKLKTGFTQIEDETVEHVMNYFQNKKNGVFVSLGAGDGELKDLTLSLEKSYGWNGLLVEPNEELFQRLKSKGRKALLSHNCVSPFSYPAVTPLTYPTVSSSDSEVEKIEKFRQTKIKQLMNKKKNVALTVQTRQCVPLENLVFAADITKIDLLVLDMNGNDLDILLNVKLDVLPDIEMVLLRTANDTATSDLSGFFLEKNLVIKKVFGTPPSLYVLHQFKEDI